MSEKATLISNGFILSYEKDQKKLSLSVSVSAHLDFNPHVRIKTNPDRHVLPLWIVVFLILYVIRFFCQSI